MQERYLSISEAATALGVTSTTLRRWDESGKLRPVRLAGSTHRKYPWSLIEKIRNQKQLAGHESPAARPKVLMTDRVIDIRSFIDTDKAFVALLQSIAVSHERFVDVEVVDGTGDLGVDIRAHEVGRHNKKAGLIYIQSKFVQSFSGSQLKAEADKLIGNVKKGELESPNKYIVACSVNIPAPQRVKHRSYMKQQIPGVEVVFWCPRELDQKIKSDPDTYERFVLKPIRALQGEALEQAPENTRPAVVAPEIKPSKPAVVKDNEQDEFSNLIERAADLIKEGEIGEARNLLLKTWGSIESTADHTLSKARILTNLGTTYLPLGEYRDLQKAETYFSQALEQKPDFELAKTNLALTYVFAGDKTKAWQILKNVRDVIASKDPRRLSLHLELKAGRDGIQKALEVYESINPKDNAEILDGDDLRRQVSSLYLSDRQYEKAKGLLEENLRIDPEDPFSLYLKGIVLLDEASEDASTHRLTFTPRFKDPKPVQESAELFQRAYTNVKDNKAANGIVPVILFNLQLCKQVLAHFYNIHVALPDPKARELLKDFDPGLNLQEYIDDKDFPSAYEEYKRIETSTNTSTDQLERVAEIFLYNGSPEYAIKIQEKIEQRNGMLPSDHWLTKSLAEVLLDNKPGAIQAAQKAVLAAEKEPGESHKRALSHQGALLTRYPREGDSILQTMLKYDATFPEENAVKKFNFEKDKDEIVRIMTSQREHIEKIKQQYVDGKVPAYALERMINRPFVEIWSQRGLDLPFFYLDPGAEFVDGMLSTLHSTDSLIFDYQSLLTLSKAKLLGLLNRLEKKLYLHFDTFNKIQEELIRCENEDLRRLWEYLRGNEDIKYILEVPMESDDLKGLAHVFDDWLLQSMQYCFNKSAVFVTDDLMLLKATNHQSAAINSFALIQEFKNLEWIDDKRFSQIKYTLAECTYTFLPFNVEDLHEAVWQADYKFTTGNLFYLEEMNLKGSEPKSFLGVFLGFTDQLWKSGALPEDKVRWLLAISKVTQDYFDSVFKKPLEERDSALIKESASIFADIWAAAVTIGNKEDLKALLKQIDEGLTLELFQGMKAKVKESIEVQLSS